MIPRFKADLGIQELIASLCFWKKDSLKQFEKAFAEEFCQKYAVAFPYGRTGLLLLIKAMGIKDAEIICPAYTCVVVSHAIVKSENTPVFIDCQDDANMDLSEVEKAITDKTKAIIFTSIFGHPVDLDQIKALKAKYPEILFIQDCAHSFDAKWNSTPVQSVGDAAFFGLNASKMFTSIFGGMVTTNNNDLHRKLIRERDVEIRPPSKIKTLRRTLYLIAIVIAFLGPVYALVYWLNTKGFIDSFTKYYNDKKIDMPKDHLEGLTNCEARVGLIQLRKYRSFINARRAYAKYYREHLKDIPEFSFPSVPEGATFSHIVAFVKDRIALQSKARTLGIELGEKLEYSIPYMPAYKNYTSSRNDWPKSKELAEQVINLPVSGVYNENNAQKVVSQLRKILIKPDLDHL